MKLRDLKHHRVIWIAFGVVALGVAILVVSVGTFPWRTAARFEHRRAAIRADGFPTSIDELFESYPRPKGENRADWIMRAADAFVEPTDEMVDVLWIGGFADHVRPTDPIPESTKRAMRAHIDANTEAIGIVRQSMAISESRFDLRLGANGWIDITHLSSLRRLTRLLYNEAVLASEMGDIDQSAEALLALFSIPESLSAEPVTLSQISRNALLTMGRHSLEQCVNRTQFSTAQLLDLQKTIADLESTDSIGLAFAGERALLLDDHSVFHDPSGALKFSPLLMDDPGVSQMEHAAANALYEPLGLWHLDALLMLDYYDRLLEANTLPVGEQLSAARTLRAQSQQVGPLFLMTYLIAPVLPSWLEADLRSRAELRAAIVGLAASRFEADRGEFPKEADELVPDYLPVIPVDPCGGAPILYKRLENGFVAYSIGKNLVDDGGLKLEGLGKYWVDDDLTFTVERQE